MLYLNQFKTRLFCAFLLVFLAGCDALETLPGEETISLSTSQDLDFEFTGITSGQSKTIRSANTINLQAFLEDRGHDLSEIQQATVDDITIRLRFPSGETFASIQQAQLTLQAGSSSVAVSTAAGLGTARSTTMTTSGNNAGSVFRNGNVEGVLELTGASDVQDNFTIEVEIEVDLRVQGQ